MDHYDLLGVRSTANKDEIKKAYYKLALKYHPDKNKASDAETKFRAVNEAYEILIDEHKREIYDRFDRSQSKHSKNHRNHHHSRHKHDEQFFTGPSDRYSEEKQYQNELERIRRINTAILDSANLNLRRSEPSKKWRQSSNRNVFKGEILREVKIDDYEKLVFSRLRDLGR